jgi:hypothetical protein
MILIQVRRLWSHGPEIPAIYSATVRDSPLLDQCTSPRKEQGGEKMEGVVGAEAVWILPIVSCSLTSHALLVSNLLFGGFGRCLRLASRCPTSYGMANPCRWGSPRALNLKVFLPSNVLKKSQDKSNCTQIRARRSIGL